MTHDPPSEIRDILHCYDLGKLISFERNARGFVNTSYHLETERLGEKLKTFLRRYKPGITAEELVFEHALINHLVAKKSLPVAQLYRTREGKTFVRRLEVENEGQSVFYALFDFLPGDDRYTWVNPRCTAAEIVQSAIVLAQFHHSVSDFQPEGRRSEPKIVDLLPEIARTLSEALRGPKSGDFRLHAFLSENVGPIQRSIEQTHRALCRPESQGLPQTVIHCDYHPGNLKFTGSQVSGLFDFDWSKVDFRCFDVGLALWYFFAGWEGANDGRLRLDDLALFLRSYQAALEGTTGVGPLSPLELQALPTMIAAANLYVLNWGILDILRKPVDPQEYLVYLHHGLNTIRWFEASNHWIEGETHLQPEPS